MPVTDDGSAHGKLLGIVTERDYRLSRMSMDEKVADFMTPREKLVVAPDGTSLKAANDIIWDHKLNSLPIVDADDHLVALVFRKDYDSHKSNPDELLDAHKPVSYTHLDVYKRQAEASFDPLLPREPVYLLNTRPRPR